MVEFHRPADWTLLTTSRGEPAIKVDALLPGTPVLLILDRLTEASGLLDEVARDDGLDETRNTSSTGATVMAFG